MLSSECIQASHLERQALIYVRQSTPQQAISNQESLRLQYALKQRAIECGWPAERVEIIDADVGMTGTTTEGRTGFKELVSRVSLGQAGIVFAYDVTRLARNCSDWYQLLDLCGFRQCLIGDHDGIYDPGLINGRLLLGLKGQISELELHTIRARLNSGLLNKAQRGELVVALPVGYERDELGRIVKQADQETQSRIELIFSTFLQEKSLGGVVRYFNRRKLLIPRRNYNSDIIWKPPTCSAISSLLRNPTYAGAYTYGRTRHVPQDAAPHKRRKRPLEINEWKVLLQDRYPAYISWNTFLKIQAMLRDNHAEYDRKQSRGIPRQGPALLQGIVYCGQCGHQMTVQYRQGTKYICNYLYHQRRHPVCLRAPALPVEQQIIGSFWEVLASAELDLLAKAERLRQTEAKEVIKAADQQLQRLRYQAQLAERQYRKSDPDNRLVAAELERRWELSLRELKAAEESAQRDARLCIPTSEITPEIRAAWTHAGAALPEMWAKNRLTPQQKKSLLRSLIDKVVVQRSTPGTLQVRIVWKGGDFSNVDVPVTVASLSQLPFAREMEDEIVRLAKQGKHDEWIAYKLQRRGYRSPQETYLSVNTVAAIRLRHNIFRTTRTCCTPVGSLNVLQLARRLRIPASWIHIQIQRDTIIVPIDEESGRFIFPDTLATLEKIRKLQNGEVKELHF
ncbi:MAG: recombinase family protein [Bryobacterales bacterium]|nr:recombinase family protein [Bryobacterales bacterium]